MTKSIEQFPGGKISDDDEGTLFVSVRPWQDQVRIDFADMTSWIAMPPDQAREMARVLMACADVIEGRLRQ